MSSEISILGLYGILVILTLVVQASLAVPQLGMSYLATARDGNIDVHGMAARAKRCLDNSIVAMALFAPAVLILASKDAFTSSTLLAAQAFLLARIVYVPTYLLGVPWVRTLVWSVGFLATLYLYFVGL